MVYTCDSSSQEAAVWASRVAGLCFQAVLGYSISKMKGREREREGEESESE